MSAGAEQIVAAAKAFLSCASEFDASGTAPSECVVVTEVAPRVEGASGALRMLAGARAAAAGAHRETGLPHASAWLARHGGTTGRDAKTALELARSLDTHPRTKQALLEGSASLAQAKEITKADAEMPGTEEELRTVGRLRAARRHRPRSARVSALGRSGLLPRHPTRRSPSSAPA
jgi:hypothetical protein